MIIRRRYILLIVVTFIFSLFTWGSVELAREFRRGYLVWSQGIPATNLINLHFQSIIGRFFRQFSSSNKVGLPQVKLYIDQNSEMKLSESLPESGKIWVPIYYLYPDGKARKAKARFRGDNPINWGYKKKSWRVKLKKGKLINRTRTLNYIVPQSSTLIENHLAYEIGKDIGLLSPRSRTVELFINEKSFGVYTEVEQLDENFLRNNNIMPVNIYKGEQYYTERRFMADVDLFDNPSLWKKTAVFNQFETDNYSDLEYFLSLINRAEGEKEVFMELKKVGDSEEWARFSAFQTLVQSWHNDLEHNMRILSDPWKGTLTPIVHDTIYKGLDTSPDFIFDKISHTLSALYENSSEILLKKYGYLYEAIEQKVLSKNANKILDLKLQLETSLKRDFLQIETELAVGKSPNIVRDYGINEKLEHLSRNLIEVEKRISSEFQYEGSGSWWQNDDRKGLGITVNGRMPISSIFISYDVPVNSTYNVFWDKNGDNQLQAGELEIPFKRESNNKIKFDIALISNRRTEYNGTGWPTYLRASKPSQVVPTTFKFVVSGGGSVENVSAENPFNKKSIVLQKKPNVGVSPSSMNFPVLTKVSNTPLFWDNDISIDETTVLDKQVIIGPGVTIKMKKGVSLIFRNKLLVKGTSESPVSVIGEKEGEIWGTFGISGPKTENSIIENINISGGSGAQIKNARYTSMFSIHNTKNIKIKNFKLSNNFIFDDMMHVIYTDKITISNCILDGSLMDSLDIDLSTAKIENCKFSNSGNDSIDLMGSHVVIKDSVLDNSLDKGVSVGEGSTAMIFSTIMTNNGIGVESKESSSAYIVNSDLRNNRIQANAYKKNWRYGQGGNIHIEKSIVESAENRLNADKFSNVFVMDSLFVGSRPILKKKIEISPSCDYKGVYEARESGYSKQVEEQIKIWSLTSAQGTRRGAKFEN